MTTFSNQHTKRRQRGFSLTEVAIAMAVISVSLVALLGLTASTLQTGKASADETTMTTAAHEVLDVLRAHTFATLPYVEPTPAKDVAQTTTTPTFLPTIYVAADGGWLSPEREKWPLNPEGTVNLPDGAVFKCVATIEPEATTLTPKALSNTDSETSVNLLRVQVALSPIIATATAKPTVLIRATIPRQ